MKEFLEALKESWPGIAGVALSVFYYDRKETLKNKIINLAVGLIVMHFVGGALVEFMSITKPIFADSIKFSFGLMGMALINAIREGLLEEIPKAMRALIARFVGGK
jgi:RsiW-degrading membrane proteinase PrsW (M82 family)